MKFRVKLTIAISLLISITFGVGASILISSSFSTMLEQQKEIALSSYENVRSTLVLINMYGETAEYKNMSDAMEKMDKQGISKWQGVSLMGEHVTIFEGGNTELLTENLPVSDSDKCTYVIGEDKEGHYIQILSVIFAGEERYLLKARYDLSDAYTTRETQQKLFITIFGCVVVIGALLAFSISFALTKKLKRLNVTAKRIAAGDYSMRSNIKTKDEFGQLSQNFDLMTDKLQKNIDELENEMEKQEVFMGAFAHELKTPMTSIIGYADLLRQGGLSEQDTMASANYIYLEGKRLEKLSFKLLDLLLLEKEEPTMKEISLSYLFSYIHKVLTPIMKKRKIKLICKCDSAVVCLEPDLIKSLIYNLVDNASKAVSDGGFVVISGKKIPNGCRIQVSDNGRGMAEEELSKITEAFYRVDKSRSRQQGGVGLGLALCRKIVEIHNGTLSFTSSPGKGTTVIVELFDKEETDE